MKGFIKLFLGLLMCDINIKKNYKEMSTIFNAHARCNGS